MRLPLLFVLWLPLPMLAHGASTHGLALRVQADDKGVRVEAYFTGNDIPAVGAKVWVEQGPRRVAEGVTDGAGRWQHAAALPAGAYKVVVDADAGHRAEKPISIVDAAQGTQPTTPTHPEAPRQEPPRDELAREGGVSTMWTKTIVLLASLFGVLLVFWMMRRQAALAQ